MLYFLAICAVVPIVGILASGGDWRNALRYTAEWCAVVGALALVGGVLALIFA